MSTKRKSNDIESDNGLVTKKGCLSDTENNNNQNSIDTVTESSKINATKKLPEDILQRYHGKPGKLLIAGNVSWENCNKKGEKQELVVFNRFTDEKVKYKR